MSHYVTRLQAQLRRRFFVQIILLVAVAAVAGIGWGPRAALGAAFGGGIAVVNLLLLRWHAGRADRVAGTDVGRNMRVLYRAALERFLATVILFALGLGAWTLPPLPLLIGFFVNQAVQLGAGYQNRNRGLRNVD